MPSSCPISFALFRDQNSRRHSVWRSVSKDPDFAPTALGITYPQSAVKIMLSIRKSFQSIGRFRVADAVGAANRRRQASGCGLSDKSFQAVGHDRYRSEGIGDRREIRSQMARMATWRPFGTFKRRGASAVSGRSLLGAGERASGGGSTGCVSLRLQSGFENCRQGSGFS